MKIDNTELRDLLKRIETKAAAALASQPHDEGKCTEGLMRTIREIAEMAGFCFAMVAFLWLYCAVTPPQMSGEYDLAAEATAAYLAEGGAE
jgi:hypothetical protein